MKAVYCTQYGGVENLKIVEVKNPVPEKKEVLVQVMATTVQTADWRVRTLELPRGMSFIGKLALGFNRPRQPILGTEFSGKVTRVGPDVTQFKIGDDIIGATGAKFGAHAEFIKISEDAALVKKPLSLSYADAASLPFGGITALDFLKYRAQIKQGEKVLINGASGSVGVAAIQIAKILGAEVTAVCGPGSIEFVRSFGVQHVLDYTQIHFWKKNQKYDVVFDIIGNLEISDLLKVLNRNGRLILVAAGLGQMLGSVVRNLFSKEKIFCGVALETKAMLAELVGLVESGQYRAVVEKELPLSEIAQAHRLVQSRHKHGNVVIIVG